VPEIAVLVQQRRDMVGAGAEVVRRGLYVGQEAWMRCVRGVGDDHLLQLIEQRGQ
jgi:hypothetical protein